MIPGIGYRFGRAMVSLGVTVVLNTKDYWISSPIVKPQSPIGLNESSEFLGVSFRLQKLCWNFSGNVLETAEKKFEPRNFKTTPDEKKNFQTQEKKPLKKKTFFYSEFFVLLWKTCSECSATCSGLKKRFLVKLAAAASNFSLTDFCYLCDSIVRLCL